MKFIKRHIIMIVIVLIFSIITAIIVNNYLTTCKENIVAFQDVITKCQNGYYDNITVEGFNKDEYCSKFATDLENLKTNKDTVWTFFNFFTLSPLDYLQIFGIFLVIIPAIIGFHKETKSGFFKNVLTRMDYKKYIKKNVISSYKYAFIFPVYFLFLFFISYLISGNFDLNRTLQLYPNTFYLQANFIPILPQFMFALIFNFFLEGILWINLAYIIDKNSNNIIMTIVLTFLTLIGIELVLQIGIGRIPYLLFGIGKNLIYYVMMFNMWNFDYVTNLPLKLCTTLIYILISFIILKKIYKSKESVIIENE